METRGFVCGNSSVLFLGCHTIAADKDLCTGHDKNTASYCVLFIYHIRVWWGSFSCGVLLWSVSKQQTATKASDDTYLYKIKNEFRIFCTIR